MDKIISEIKNTTDKVIKKSGELVELSKVKFQISSTKSEIGAGFKELGELVYHAQKTEENPDANIIEGTITKIDGLYEKLDVLMAEYFSLKNEKLCPSCENRSPKSAQFCSECGYKFDAPEEVDEEPDEFDEDVE